MFHRCRPLISGRIECSIMKRATALPSLFPSWQGVR